MQNAETFLGRAEARNQAYFLADAAVVSGALPLEIKPDDKLITTRWLAAFIPNASVKSVLAKPIKFEEWKGDEVINGPISPQAGKIFVGPLLSAIDLGPIKDIFFTQYKYGDKTIGMPIIVERKDNEFEMMMVRERRKGKGEYELVLVPPSRYGDDLTLTDSLKKVAGSHHIIRPVIVETPNFVSRMITDKDRVGKAIAAATGAADFWASRLHKNLTGDPKQANIHKLCMFINERQRDMFGRKPQIILPRGVI